MILRREIRTDDVYRTCNLPLRFMYPKLFRGYRQLDSPLPHPCYRSSSMEYGWHAPTIHTVPTTFYPRNTSFSSDLIRAGMYQNCSLNTELDKSLF
ncbi:UPF0691 protein C9orf116 homolog [Orussus abietinus]|uniref:UPF0691 protein C9orf116 homolog n=1 Tax=Orussus abietinus TaxID=222816 RepID=UPI0006259F4A|nr:UPF0691 protein C9orf116 homolog [Orussus abietinus]